jgi:acyl carrier protein
MSTQEAARGQEDTGLTGIVAAVMGVSPGQLSDEDGPSTVESWTSRKQIELLVAVEEHYGLSLDDQEVFAAGTIGGLRKILRGRGALA